LRNKSQIKYLIYDLKVVCDLNDLIVIGRMYIVYNLSVYNNFVHVKWSHECVEHVTCLFKSS